MSSEQLQGFFESTMGQVSVVAAILLLFLGILVSGKGKKTDTENQKKLYKFTKKQEKNKNFPVRDHGKHKILLEIKVLLGTK